VAACLAGLASGCNYVVLAGYLLGGPPAIEPEFDQLTNKSMTAHDVTVAVVCYAPTELKWDSPKIDFEVAQYVTYNLRDHKVKVASPESVRNWTDRNPDWDTPEEIGAALGVTYVVYIDLSEFTLYEENSTNLYRGQAEALVSVYEMEESGEGEKVYSKEIISKFPLLGPRSTSEVSYDIFRRQYLTRLSEDIGRLFYEHYAGDDIHDAT
jgi:hypothetical protein